MNKNKLNRAVIAIILLSILFIFTAAFLKFFPTDYAENIENRSSVMNIDFNNAETFLNLPGVVTGFRNRPNGLDLGIGETGMYSLSFPSDNKDYAQLLLWFNKRGPGSRNKAEYSLDGGKTYALLMENQHLYAANYLIPLNKENNTVMLRFTAKYGIDLRTIAMSVLTHQKNIRAPIIEHILINSFNGKPFWFDFNTFIIAIMYLFFIPLLTFLTAYILSNWQLARYVFLSTVLLLVLFIICTDDIALLRIIAAYSFYTIVIMFFLSYLKIHNDHEKKEIFKKYALFLLFLVILLFGTEMRLDSFRDNIGNVNWPDVHGYTLHADSFSLFNHEHGFYSASFNEREPLYLFVTSLFFKIFGSSNSSIRLVSLFFSILLMIASYLIAKRIFNSFVGILTVLPLSVIPYLIDFSIRGMRLEIYSFLTLLLFYCLFIYQPVQKNSWNPNIKKAAITGLVGGCLALTQLESIIPIFLIFGYSLFSKKNKVRHLLISGLLILLMIAPLLINNYIKHDTMFYSTDTQTKWWRNYEFCVLEHRSWCSPTSELINNNNMYAGPKTSTYEYVFKDRNIHQIFQKYLFGYYHALIRLAMEARILGAFGLAGLFFLLFTKKRCLVFFILVFIFPAAFIMPLAGSESRYVMHVFPLFLMSAAFYILLIYRFFKKILAKLSII